MKYIVLLRGINVGGRNKLPMADLRELLRKNGYHNITTYIQSGNIILSSNNNANTINNHIKDLLHKTFNYTIAVITLTVAEINACFTNNPFLDTENDGKFLHVTFLNNAPSKALIPLLNINTQANETYKIIDKFVYLYTPDGFAKTKFTNTQFEKKLNTEATTRNWKTVGKLVALANTN